MSRTVQVFKVTGPNGEAHIAQNGFIWPLPKGQQLGKWVHCEGELEECANGLHACRSVLDIGVHMTVNGFTVWFAEAKGAALEGSQKTVFRSLRLVRRSEWCKEAAALFAADCAERSMTRSGWDDERSWNAVVVSRRVALGLISAARSAAWSARSAESAAWSAESAESAAWSARSAAREAERVWQDKRLLQYLEYGITAHTMKCDGWKSERGLAE